MLELGASRPLREAIGAEGRAFVERYRWDAVWRRYEAVLAGRGG